MHVLGFDEALRTAEHVELELGLTVRVASIPGYVLPKIIAWRDRGTSASLSKDAGDIVRALLGHGRISLDRVYDEVPADVLEAFGFDIDRSGAWMLGREVASIALPRTRAMVMDLMTASGIERIASGGIVSDARSDASIQRNAELIQDFVLGMPFLIG